MAFHAQIKSAHQETRACRKERFPSVTLPSPFLFAAKPIPIPWNRTVAPLAGFFRWRKKVLSGDGIPSLNSASADVRGMTDPGGRPKAHATFRPSEHVSCSVSIDPVLCPGGERDEQRRRQGRKISKECREMKGITKGATRNIPQAHRG